MGLCKLDFSPRHNWVENAGGLPEFMHSVACGIMRSGRDVSSSIKIAVGKVEDWASGKGKVNAKTRAKAVAAVAEWNAKRAKAKSSAKLSNSVEQDFFDTPSSELFDDSILRFSNTGEVKLKTTKAQAVEAKRLLLASGISVGVDTDEDVNSLASAVDAALDQAVALFTSVDTDGCPPEVLQGIALVVAAEAVADNLLDALGIEDPDDEDASTDPNDPQKDSTGSQVGMSVESALTKVLRLAASKPVLGDLVTELRLAARDFSTEQRKKYSDAGVAMPDGSFPIPDTDSLDRARQSLGRANPADRDKVIQHIKKRAKALGVTLPTGWPN